MARAIVRLSITEGARDTAAQPPGTIACEEGRLLLRQLGSTCGTECLRKFIWDFNSVLPEYNDQIYMTERHILRRHCLHIFLMRLKAYGLDDVSTLHAIYSLGLVYEEQGGLGAADQTLNHALRGY